MNDPISISYRAAENLQQMFDQLEQLPKTIQAHINALAAQLDIPTGWRFDPDSMTFVPPTNQAAADQGEPTPQNDTVEA